MIKDWDEVIRAALVEALANEYGNGNPRWSLEACSAEEAARTAMAGLKNTLQQFHADALYQGSISGAEASMERVREAYEDGRTNPEDIIRAAGPQEGRKRR